MDAIRRHHERERRAAARMRRRAPAAPADATRVARRGKRARRSSLTAAAVATGLDPLDPATGERLCTDIRNQGNADERCIAFAVAAAMETAICRERNTRSGVPEISVNDVFTRGGVQVGAIDTIQDAVRQGVVDAVCFPASATQRCAQPAPHTWFARVRALQAPPSQRIERMCRELENKHPLVAFIEVFANFRNFAGGGPFAAVGPSIGFHAVCIIGFEGDAAGQTGRWIAKNSMGATWGDGGFFTMTWRDPRLLPENTVFVVEDVHQ